MKSLMLVSALSALTSVLALGCSKSALESSGAAGAPASATAARARTPAAGRI
jgi:hypothetical protein